VSSIPQRAQRFLPVLTGALVGAVFALYVANQLQARFAEVSLLNYARYILHVEEATAIDARQMLTTVSTDHLAFCSDDELTLMRRLVFDSAFIKDIGRIKDGELYCTSSLGRLPHPVKMPAPRLSFQTPDGALHVDITSSPTLLFAPGAKGIIASSQGVSVVLNPLLYAHLDNPPLRFTGLIYDHQHKTFMFGFGHSRSLPAAQVLAQKAVERDGTIYQPLCSQSYAACVIAFESKSDMMVHRPGYFTGLVSGGAFLGMSIAALILLFQERQQSFEQRLRRAIRKRQLTCVYQPILELESGTIVGAEALARWTDESGEAVPPDAFIPVAEAEGFVTEITRLVIDRVIHEIGGLLTEPGFLATINITVQDLTDPEFFDYLAQRIRQSGIRPSALAFELTERFRIDNEIGKPAVARLRDAGHLVLIDDFGTGYSSLAYLQDMHVDAIKIDRVFTQTIGTEAVIASVLPQILYLASRLGLSVVAEGVENSKQADYFCKAAPGILAQGWFLGKPVPPAELKRMYADYRNSKTPV